MDLEKTIFKNLFVVVMLSIIGYSMYHISDAIIRNSIENKSQQNMQ